MPRMFIVLAIIAYLLGSISSAVLICKFMGLPDPRTEGSRNPGATNVLRLGGKQAALIVLIADALKGFIPVILGRMVGVSPFALALIALIALLGHIYPVFFKFEGGKGVATAIGAVFGLSFFAGLFAVLTWVAVIYFTRYSSLAALITAVLLPFYALIFGHAAYFFPVLIMTSLLIWRHWENIERLRNGTETKVVF
ncbi:MAG: glycerol-3-phosphate 1-O-acyltransferase PlsY [Gammaproteobacteria bacterium]|nr:glycerol-3-phosphate 1-O-acyltransferase PlsY [Gammaproteobacteria bacterium]